MLVEDVERQMQDGIAGAGDPERAAREDDAGIVEDALRGRDRERVARIRLQHRHHEISEHDRHGLARAHGA